MTGDGAGMTLLLSSCACFAGGERLVGTQTVVLRNGTMTNGYQERGNGFS